MAPVEHRPLRLVALAADMVLRRWTALAATAGVILLAVLAASFVLAGCTGNVGSDSAASPAATSSDPPNPGGVLTLSYLGEPTSLDPAVAASVLDRQVVRDVYEGLLRYAPASPDGEVELVPCLATELPSVENGGISADGTVYTFHLRQGVRFQPPVSRAVEAADFKYSFERMMRQPGGPGAAFYRGVTGAGAFLRGRADEISGLEAVDAATVRITLAAPDPAFLHAITLDFCDVVPREWVERWGEEFARHPLGTGPFAFQKWDPGSEIVLTRNPDYWEDGKPYLDGIDYQLSLDPAEALLKLERGEVDVLGDGVPAPDLARLMTDPAWTGRVVSQPVAAAAYLFLNVTKQPFDDVEVRRALSWAIDRDKLAELQGGRATSLWQFYPEGVPGHEQGKVYHGYDPARARRLLARAGYPDGFRTTLSTDDVDPNPRVMAAVRADLAAVGVHARLTTMSADSYAVLRATPDTLAAGSLGRRSDFPDPAAWIDPLAGKAGAVAGGTNPSFWWSPKLERMRAAARHLTDPEARIDAYRRMQEHLVRSAPYVPCYQPVQTTACSKTTGGFSLHPVYQIDPTQYWKK